MNTQASLASDSNFLKWNQSETQIFYQVSDLCKTDMLKEASLYHRSDIVLDFPQDNRHK